MLIETPELALCRGGWLFVLIVCKIDKFTFVYTTIPYSVSSLEYRHFHIDTKACHSLLATITIDNMALIGRSIDLPKPSVGSTG